MVADLEAVSLDHPPPPGIELRTVGAAGVEDMVAVHDAVFGGSHRALGAAVLDGLEHGSVVPVVAYDGEQPVAAARLELFPDASFAGLYGDSTLGLAPGPRDLPRARRPPRGDRARARLPLPAGRRAGDQPAAVRAARVRDAHDDHALRLARVTVRDRHPRLPAGRRRRRRARRAGEFVSLEEIRSRLGPRGVTGYLPAYGRDGGAITDDTQMALFTAEGLVAEEALAPRCTRPRRRSPAARCARSPSGAGLHGGDRGQHRRRPQRRGGDPPEWLEALELRDVIEQVAEDLVEAFHGPGVGGGTSRSTLGSTRSSPATRDTDPPCQNSSTPPSPRSTATSPTSRETGTGPPRTPRSTRSSTTSSGRSARTSTGAACTRCSWPGRPWTTRTRTCATTRRSGARPRRSSTRARSSRSQARVRGSSAASTRRPCASSSAPPRATSRSAARGWRPRPSPRAWSTECTCSSRP